MLVLYLPEEEAPSAMIPPEDAGVHPFLICDLVLATACAYNSRGAEALKPVHGPVRGRMVPQVKNCTVSSPL